MSSEFDDREPSLKLEEVERRGEPRGIMRDLKATVDGAELPVVEASRKGLFLGVENPDSYALGQSVALEVSSDASKFSCRAEVVRKEIEPRRGVALRIVHMTPVAEETFKQILEGS